MKRISITLLSLLFVGLSAFLTSCFKDLDVVPLGNSVTAATVYDDVDSYKKVLAKLYAGLALSGQEGPAGQPDISGIDEGFSTYLRQYWKAQELTTDEAVIAWNDGNIHDFHQQDWDANNEFITAMYNRIFYQIALVNEFIRETTDEKMTARGASDAIKAEVATYRAEARFLRALSYYHALDMFRNVPFVTEEDAVGSFFPTQTNTNDLFAYVESELKAVESLLVDARANEYARADKAAAWMVLAKLYLNAEVYLGEGRYTEAAEYCQKVIDAGFSLDANYADVFKADNHNSTEMIFPIAFDGTRSKTWGGMTFLVHAAVGGSMSPSEFGIDGGWGGVRTTKAIVDKFPSTAGGSVLVAPSEGNTASYAKLYVPGSYQGWDPANESTTVTSPNNDSTYEGYFWFAAGDKFKFAPEANWDNAYGDDGGALSLSGADIPVAEAGLYHVVADIKNLTYTLEKTEWGIIGSATPGAWDNDTDMAYDTTDNSVSIVIDLAAGEIKFRANDDWALNYGDTGADAILEAGGDNIVVPAGTYRIKLFLDKPDYTYSIELVSFDKRAMFHTDGQNLEIEDIAQFTEGYAVAKYFNVTSTGLVGSDVTFVDTDFPLFRLADAYLMYAEAVVRGGGGSMASAVNYVNTVRERAYGGSGGNITQSELTLDFLIDERARELLWECHRRTDLIRFGKFSESSYVWPWKGGTPGGVSTDKKYNVFPIPASDIGANPNLQQNTGY